MKMSVIAFLSLNKCQNLLPNYWSPQNMIVLFKNLKFSDSENRTLNSHRDGVLGKVDSVVFKRSIHFMILLRSKSDPPRQLRLYMSYNVSGHFHREFERDAYMGWSKHHLQSNLFFCRRRYSNGQFIFAPLSDS